MTWRPARLLGVVGSTLVALVLTHSLVFLVRYGSLYGEALAHSGHDLAWTIAVVGAVGLGIALGLAGAIQLVRLARAAWIGQGVVPSESGPRFVRPWLSVSMRLIAMTAVLLTIQENVERAGAGLPTPGIGLVFSPENPWAGILVALVGLVVGLVVSLFRWRRDVLTARIRAGRRSPRRTTVTPMPRRFESRLTASLLGRTQGLRAPPSAIAS